MIEAKIKYQELSVGQFLIEMDIDVAIVIVQPGYKFITSNFIQIETVK